MTVSGPAGVGGSEWPALWIAVLEFVRPDGGRPFLGDVVHALLTHLAEWHPSGLLNPARYAIQLQVPGWNAHEALQRALSSHDEAARAVELPAATLVRIEVMTVEDYERSLEEYHPQATPATAATPLGLLCDEVYSATRRLHEATTRRDLADILIGFVVTIGGHVEPGTPRHLPGTIDVDMSLEGDDALHASAEAVSVAGLIIEQSLPALLAAARQALTRLEGDRHYRRPPTSP